MHNNSTVNNFKKFNIDVVIWPAIQIPLLSIIPIIFCSIVFSLAQTLVQNHVFFFKQEKNPTYLFIFKVYFIYYAIIVVPVFFSPLFSSALHTLSHQNSPHLLSSCPWVIHISSLASTFPTLFLTSPCLFSTYHLCYLFSAPFPCPTPLLITPPCDLHFCGSISVLVVCLICFCFCFRCGC